MVKTISVVEDSKMVKEKERETETDEQGTVFVQQPKNTDDAKVILTDVTLEKEKEDETTQKPEEVFSFSSEMLKRVNILFWFVQVSVETETKNSQEQEKDISKVLVDTAHVFKIKKKCFSPSAELRNQYSYCRPLKRYQQ